MRTESSRLSNPGAGAPPQADPVFTDLEDGLRVNEAAWAPRAAEVLTQEIRATVAALHRTFEPRRAILLQARADRQARVDGGELPGYEPADRSIAEIAWSVAPLPPDLRRRRVEITGPINDPKMVINMLSPGPDGRSADAAMLDFEDSMAPTWPNFIDGLHNLVGVVDGTLEFEKRDEQGTVVRRYRIDRDSMPLLMVRVRGLHLSEPNLTVDGHAVSAGLLDLVATILSSARKLMAAGRTPKLYIPKCEHPHEARWWCALIGAVEQRIGMSTGTVRVTLLIETLPAAFHLERILYEIRTHAAALNVGRWDKIFSDIKVLREHPDRLVPDRATVSMNRPWMHEYARRLVRVCHRRDALAIGGMAAFTPGRTEALRLEQTAKVVADKRLESEIGHDGCWVSHPYFIGPALDQFVHDNQLSVIPDGDPYPDLLPQPTGPQTLDGLRTNVRAGIAYLEGWNQGIGCVAWDDLMEDLATLEISRAQTWQWLYHAAKLSDGTTVTRALVEDLFKEQQQRIAEEIGAAMAGASSEAIAARIASFDRAATAARQLFTEPRFRDFLTDRSPLVRAGARAAG